MRILQEQERLTLEAELAKSKAKEQVLSSIMEAAAPRSFVLDPISLKAREGEKKVEASIVGLETKPVGANGRLTVAVGGSTLNPEAAEWYQRPFATTNRKECAIESEHSAASSPSERAFHEMLGLHYQQNALQQQQKKSWKMLATQQKKSNLPQQRVLIFDGDPMEFNPFVRTFENIIESKTSNNSEKL